MISSHYLNVTARDLQDVLTTIPEHVVPTVDSVWMELPYRDVCNRDTFYPAVTSFVKQCKHYHVPFIMLYADRDSVEWSSFKEINQMTERLTCSCQYPELQSLSDLHLKRGVYHVNARGSLPDGTCPVQQTGRLKECNRNAAWFQLYRSICSRLIKPSPPPGLDLSVTRAFSVNVDRRVVEVPSGTEATYSPKGPADSEPALVQPELRSRSRTRQLIQVIAEAVTQSQSTAQPQPVGPDESCRVGVAPVMSETGSAQRLPDSPSSSDAVNVPSGIEADPSAVATTTILDTNTEHQCVTAYPTASRERRKAREKAAKEAGTPLEVVKKTKYVEPHFDDCGEDLSSLRLDESESDSKFVNIIYYASNSTHHFDVSSSAHSSIVDQLFLTMLYGSVVTVPVPQVFRATDLDQLSLVVNTRGPGYDIAEVCGGVARTTRVGVRRKLRCGPNFDLVTGCDLCTKEGQHQCFRFFQNNLVLVAILAPVCGPYGPLANLNWHLHPAAMIESIKLAKPIAWTCGQVALIQLKKKLDFIAEQPYPTRLYAEDPWPSLFANNPQVVQVVYVADVVSRC